MFGSNIFQVALITSIAISQNEKITSVTPNQSTIYYKTKQNPNHAVQPQIKTRIPQSQELLTVGNWNYNRSIIKEIERDPAVYVSHADSKERLVYNRKKMEVGKLYKIEWLGQKFALMKRADDHVDLYEFTPKKK